MKTAIIFPGQGVQTIGMGKDLYNNFKEAKEIFEIANDILHRNIANICFEGPENELQHTINSQPAILTVSLAAYEVLKNNTNIKADCYAGHSLGEYGALYASGVLNLEDAFALISKRAELMHEVASKSDGMMAAVLGTSAEFIQETISGLKDVYIANYNSQLQTVITGEKNAIMNAVDVLKKNNIKKIIPLAVSGAFHSPFMIDAANKFKEFVSSVKISDANAPVFTNIDSLPTTLAVDFKEKMVKQIYSPVMWYQSVLNMTQNGVENFYEVGQGKVLTGLIKRIVSEAKLFNISDSESIKQLLSVV